MTFYEKLYLLCTRSGFEISNIKQETGLPIDKSTVSRWKRGAVPRRSTVKALADYFNVSVDFLRDDIDAAQISIRPVQKKRFRMLGNVACGEPIYMEEDYETYVEANSDIKADFCLTAQGDSMINARIFDGDVVFIRSQPDVENGEIAAVAIGDDVTLKRVYKYPDRLELRPENPTHRVQNYEGEELDRIHILGKAVAFQSYVR